ncbi:MAG: hypothetical protein FJ263_06595 [Planctomycetes bacterium]|nr:hypothetical protein [Planctomycetota bacterium]
MTTQQNKSSLKTLHKILRFSYAFIRWTAVAVALLLLLTGLALGVPWRVSLVFTVIPAVGIFMPRDLQKWCWMAMATVAAGIYAWIHIPEQDASQWQPYVFKKKIAEFNARRHIPDEDNAAIRYEALFARHEEDLFAYPMEQETDIATYLESWDEDDRPELTQWLKTLEPDMTALIAIAQIPDCRFEPPVDMASLQRQFKRINTTKAFVREMLRSANQDLSKGRLDAAKNKQMTVLRMARHLWLQETLLDQAAGYFLERMARRAMSRFVIDYAADANSLQAIEEAWDEADSRWPGNWAGVLDCEKMQTVSIAGAAYQQNDAGHIRFSRNISQTLRYHFGSRIQKSALPPEMSRTIALGLGFVIPTAPEGTARLIEDRFDRISAIATAGFDIETTTPANWWNDGLNASAAIDWHARRQTAYFYPLNTQDRQFEQDRAAMRILIAVKRYRLDKGNWPDRLEDVFGEKSIPADPHNKKTFVYKKQTGGFTFYSLGANGIDDGGVKNSYVKPKLDDILFWPAKTLNGEEGNGITDGNGK